MATNAVASCEWQPNSAEHHIAEAVHFHAQSSPTYFSPHLRFHLKPMCNAATLEYQHLRGVGLSNWFCLK